jgi:hypothetical protein
MNLVGQKRLVAAWTPTAFAVLRLTKSGEREIFHRHLLDLTTGAK